MKSASIDAFLPPRLREIARVVGVDAALKLAQAYPGLRVYVPQKIEKDHPIAKAISLVAARKLCAAFGLEVLSVPAGKRLIAALTRQRIVERYRAGESAAKLAREYELHEFSVFNMAAAQAQQAPLPQLKLFDEPRGKENGANPGNVR